MTAGGTSELAAVSAGYMSADPEAVYVLLSARFTDPSIVAFVKKLGRAMKAIGISTFWVDAGAGDDFGLQTSYGVAHMKGMVAICTETYGQKTASPHCAFYEVKAASESHCPIIPIRLCSWPVWEAGMGGRDFDSPHNSGADQNRRFVCPPSMIALDRSEAYANGTLDANECAAKIMLALEGKGSYKNVSQDLNIHKSYVFTFLYFLLC